MRKMMNEKKNSKKKLFIFGLDGASPVLIEKWIDDLPNFKKLIENGVFGVLNSTIPPFSCPAWNSFMTGKNPGKIGIFDFQVGISQFDVSSYPSIVNLTYQDSPTFWDILSDFGYRVGIINVPLTYPPARLKGFMISGFLTPPEAKDYTYPGNLVDEIEKHITNYEPTEFVEMTAPSLMKRGEDGFIEENYRSIDNILKITNYLMENNDWDILVDVFTPLDRMQHYFWHFMDKNHPKYDASKARKYKNVLRDFYIKFDSIIGKIQKKLNDNTNIIIMSDHGFGPAYGYFYINNFLRDKGFLKVKKRGLVESFLSIISSGGKNILKIMAKLGILELPFIKDAILGEKSIIRRLTPKSIKLEHPYMRSRSFLDLDWNSTKAYAFGNNKIFINLEGRESKGTVSRGEEYRELVKELKESLCNEKSPVSDEKLFSGVYGKDEIYDGKYVEEAPDIIVMGNEISFKMGNGKGSVYEIPGLQSGDHRREGLLIMNGPDIKSGVRVDADIIDIAPTVLYMNKIGIPKDIDGKVIKRALKLKYDIEYQEPIKKEREVVEFTEEENKELQKRLKGLGYA